MKTNMGFFDRLIRGLIAAIIAVTYANGHIISGTAAVIAIIIAGVLAVTAIAGFCPLYFPFGISTKAPSEDTGYD